MQGVFDLVILSKPQAVIEDLARRDERRYPKVLKCLARLSDDPRHPGLQSHPYAALNEQFGQTIWESYAENHIPAAWRVWWFYGIADRTITVVLIGRHP